MGPQVHSLPATICQKFLRITKLSAKIFERDDQGQAMLRTCLLGKQSSTCQNHPITGDWCANKCQCTHNEGIQCKSNGPCSVEEVTKVCTADLKCSCYGRKKRDQEGVDKLKPPTCNAGKSSTTCKNHLISGSVCQQKCVCKPNGEGNFCNHDGPCAPSQVVKVCSNELECACQKKGRRDGPAVGGWPF